MPADDDRTSRPWLKRHLSQVEPALQHNGVIYTIVFFYVLVNLVLFFSTAAPAWREAADADATAVIRVASAIARGSAASLNLNSALVILVAARTLMTYLRGTILSMFIPFDKAMPAFHSLIGNALVIGTLIHTIAHIVRYAVLNLHRPGLLAATGLAVTGSILAMVMLAIKITALKRVRKRSFETFYWVHSIGVILFFSFLIMHGSHKGILKTWMYVLAPLAVYFLDRLIRLLREKGSRLTIPRSPAVCRGPDMVCLRVPRTFPYIAGQYCDIKVPQVSELQWHPFTIASSPHENEMLFFIKVNGDWTRRLYALFKDSPSQEDLVSIYVRGPYGAPAQHAGQYEHVVLISGGVGATPFASITKYVHHWILNYTAHGQVASNSVSAQFTRNQSVQGTPSMPGTPSRFGGTASGFASGQRSNNPSRGISRSGSNNFVRNISGTLSRDRSVNGSRGMSRSDSGRAARMDSRGFSRSTSGALERLDSRGVPLHMASIEKSHSDHSLPIAIHRNLSVQTDDSVVKIIHEQRMNQPNGPASANQNLSSPSPNHGMSLSIPGMAMLPTNILNRSGSTPGHEMPDPETAIAHFLSDNNHVSENYHRPDDYDDELGNPEAPIPDRRSGQPAVSPVTGATPPTTASHQTFEIVTEYDSSQALFDDEDELEDITGSRQAPPSPPSDLMVASSNYLGDPFDIEEQGGLELENRILREQTTTSNALNMLGMSFAGTAMMRHLHELDSRKLRSSMVRASMNLMDDALDASLWQDRLLFYFHTVTVNWLTFWIMLFRYALLIVASITALYSWETVGLGVFSSLAVNITDFILAILITVPIVGSIATEVYVNGYEAYLSDGLGNSFDLYLMTPLLFISLGLHILNFAGVGQDVAHISKLTVLLVWTVLSLFLIWRIWRTIGSRVILAQHIRSSHARTKSVDYIWVSKTHEDDNWLLDELLPLAKSSIVRLHRFITRHGPKTEPWMLEYEKIPLKTTYSRPDWDEVFGNLVERSRSGAVIGVFFCGPDSMAQMIKQAAMKAMAKSLENSIQRGFDQKRHGREEDGGGEGRSRNRLDRIVSAGRMGATNGNKNQPGQRLPGEESRDPAQFGCSVRITVRVENFT